MPKPSKPLSKRKPKPSTKPKVTRQRIKQPGKSTQKAADLGHIEYRRTVIAANLLAGMTYREIANALEQFDRHKSEKDPNWIPIACSIGTITADVQLIFARWKAEQVSKVEEHKELRLRQLNILLNGVFDRARGGIDDKAIDSFLKITARMDAILGIDAPTVVKLSWKDEAAQKNLPVNDIYEGAIAGIMDKLRQQKGKGDDRTADVIH